MFKENAGAQATRFAIAAGFLSFGATWLAAPGWMESLFARDGFALDPIVPLALGALAAQAIAAGLFALFARFKSWTFIGLAVSVLPFLGFDAALYFKFGAFNEVTFVHAGGMLAMIMLCMLGFAITQREERLLEQTA